MSLLGLKHETPRSCKITNVLLFPGGRKAQTQTVTPLLLPGAGPNGSNRERMVQFYSIYRKRDKC